MTTITKHIWPGKPASFLLTPSASSFYYVDAHTGEMIDKYNDLKFTLDRTTYDAANGTNLPGTLKRSEGQPDIGDATLDAAHNNAGVVYNYYKNTYNRDSYDDAGATIVSSVHYSTNYNNAFWSPDLEQMVYGSAFFSRLSAIHGSSSCSSRGLLPGSQALSLRSSCSSAMRSNRPVWFSPVERSPWKSATSAQPYIRLLCMQRGFPRFARVSGTPSADCVCLINAANVVRIMGIFYVGVYAPQWLPLIHDVVGEALMILLVLLMWLIWSRKMVMSPLRPAHQTG